MGVGLDFVMLIFVVPTKGRLTARPAQKPDRIEKIETKRYGEHPIVSAILCKRERERETCCNSLLIAELDKGVFFVQRRNFYRPPYLNTAKKYLAPIR